MIQYYKGAFGLNLLLRVHGGALYRAMIPGFITIIISILTHYYYTPVDGEEQLNHPYAVGVLVGAISFLIVYRANYAYGRYWEATSATFHMMSKWLDATTHTSCYHMQQTHYSKIKPPNYYDNHDLNQLFLTRNRERGYEYIKSSMSAEEEVVDDDDNNITSSIGSVINSLSGGRRASLTTKNTANKKISPHTRQLKSINATQPGGSGSKNKKSSGSAPSDKPGPILQHTNRRASSDPGAIFRHKRESYFNKTHFASHDVVTGSSLDQANISIQSSAASHYSGCVMIEPRPLIGEPRLDGGWMNLFGDGTSTFYRPPEGEETEVNVKTLRATMTSNTTDPPTPPVTTNNISRDDDYDDNDVEGAPCSHQFPNTDDGIGDSFASTKGGRTPPLFLQELAHLSSLLMAVALATLRNDIEEAESPLDIYEPNSDWPPVDPDTIKHKDRIHKKSWGSRILHWLGADPTREERTKYNAARPLPVLGGVSDAEIIFLQMAKGPSAKTQLAWNWLSEFIIREHLAGSTGAVGPPIISRIIQFLGDGMIYYNHARKIMFIPFPFPHAQLSAFFILIIIPAIPFLLDQYAVELWLSCILSFLTVTCLSGLHEVARELENPFRNVPNELPLVTFQAMYNEALITMYAGYHPDSYFNPNAIRRSCGVASTSNNNDNNNNSNNDNTEQQKRKSEKFAKTRSEEAIIPEVRELASVEEEEEETASIVKDDNIEVEYEGNKETKTITTTKQKVNGGDSDDVVQQQNNMTLLSPPSPATSSSSTSSTSTPPHIDLTSMDQLRNVILEQSKELERLRLLVEGSPNSTTISGDKKNGIIGNNISNNNTQQIIDGNKNKEV